jgi:hypothetical protein
MVWAGRSFGIALFLDRAIQRMATVRHLGLFPFCVSPYPPNSNISNGGTAIRETGPLTEYPFKLPIRLCTRMWWTVKHWRISFDYYQFRDLSDEYNPGDYTLIDQSVLVTTSSNTLFGGGPDYVKAIENGLFGFDISERKLVCVTSGTGYEEASRMNSWSVQLSREFLIEGSSGTSSIEAELSFYTNWDNQQLGFSAPFAKSEEDDSNLWTAIAFSFASWRSDFDAEGESGSGTFKLLDVERQFSISRTTLSEGTTETISNLVIEPAEFWPYDPDDGLGPIYDSQTGAQLRAFPA